MKHLLHRITLGMILCTGAMAAADEAAPRRLGDAAFYAGDYRNAISSYKSAMETAERTGNQEELAASALNLAVAYLHNGEVAEARRILEIFRQRFPLRSTGTLEGDLLAYEGKYAEAEKFYLALKTNDPIAEDARLFSLATLYMNMGGEKNLARACDIFMLIAGELPWKQQMRSVDGIKVRLISGEYGEAYRELGETLIRPDSPWRRYAASEAIYTLIRLRRLDQAEAVLSGIPASERNTNIEFLGYLAEAYSGRIDTFQKNYSSFMEKLPPVHNLRVVDLYWTASQVAVKKKNFAFADRLLYDVRLFTSDRKFKQTMARSRIEIQLQYAPEKSVETVLNYVKDFPEDQQAYQLVFNTAGKLYAMQKSDSCIVLLNYLLTVKHDPAMSTEIAKLGIFAAERCRDFTALEKFNRVLFKSIEAGQWIGFQQRYAAFLERNGKKSEAERELKQALAVAQQGRDIKLIEETAYALLGFYLRSNNRPGILSAALLLENSAVPDIAAEAKCALGDLQEHSCNYMKAREYYLAVAKMPPNRQQPRAGFQAALMAYKESEFTAAAGEFLEVAEKFPNYRKAPEALFMAIDLFDPERSAAKARKAEQLLREKYPDSQAFAVLILQLAVSRGQIRENIPALLKDLEIVEKNFVNSDFSAEAVLLRAVFLDRLDCYQEALSALVPLQHHKNPAIAAESLIRYGEILFRRKQYHIAQKSFLQANVTAPGTLAADIAMLRAVDCIMAAKNPLADTDVNECLDKLDGLIRSSKFQRVRMEAFCKKGIALEHTGNSQDALAAYEQSVYAAVDMINQGLIPEQIWCLKSCESALQLIAASEMPGALQRGLQLIERCKHIFNDETQVKRIQDNFRKQMNKKRR